jgi:hypothetical protein
VREEGGEEEREGLREGQELNNGMCSNNLNLETPTSRNPGRVRAASAD